MEDAKVTVSEVQEVVLVGGHTRQRAIQRLLNAMSGKNLVASVNPDQVLLLGAAVQVLSLVQIITLLEDLVMEM